MKPTPAQRRLLTKMRDEPTEVWTVSSPESAAWTKCDRDTVRFGTLFACLRGGWVENYETKLHGSKYRLTPAGLDAIGEDAS